MSGKFLLYLVEKDKESNAVYYTIPVRYRQSVITVLFDILNPCQFNLNMRICLRIMGKTYLLNIFMGLICCDNFELNIVHIKIGFMIRVKSIVLKLIF